MNLQGELIKHWQEHDAEKGIAPLEDKEYRRHAKAFTLLLSACGKDLDTAKRAVSEFFEDKHPIVASYGWDIGTFQKRYRAYILKVREADERKRREAIRHREALVEAQERRMTMPAPPNPEVMAKVAALRGRLFGGTK